jgi:short-subunit dehydrogenase
VSGAVRGATSAGRLVQLGEALRRSAFPLGILGGMRQGRWERVLVTGASSGIGREIARQAAARGAAVVAVARREERLRSLAEEVGRRHGRQVEVLVADLRDPGDLARVERRVADPARPVDLVVNNAGFGGSGRFHELPVDREDAEVRLNVLALLRLSHAALAAMVPRGRGGLLNVSSVAGFQPLPRQATYSATKAFVTTFTEALHGEAREAGVCVTALCPGFTRTEFQSRSGVERRELPSFVWLSAEAVARAGLDAVTRNQAVCVPGLGYRALVATEGLLPRGVLRKAVGAVVRRF